MHAPCVRPRLKGPKSNAIRPVLPPKGVALARCEGRLARCECNGVRLLLEIMADLGHRWSATRGDALGTGGEDGLGNAIDRRIPSAQGFAARVTPNARASGKVRASVSSAGLAGFGRQLARLL